MSDDIFDFHDSTINKIILNQERMFVELQDLEYLDKNQIMHVEATGINNLLVDGKPYDSFIEKTCDGEVLMLEDDHKHINLIVQWSDFDTRDDLIQSYKMSFKSIVLKTIYY